MINFLNDILPLKNKLYRTALRIARNPQEAEDIVQETLVKVWTHRETWSEIQSMQAYAFTICRNLALDFVKSKAGGNLSLEDIRNVPLVRSDETDARMDETARLDRIERFLDSLPEKQRTCFHLRDVEGLSYKEIATVMNISEEQVKVNIFRARKAVKERLFKIR